MGSEDGVEEAGLDIGGGLPRDAVVNASGLDGQLAL